MERRPSDTENKLLLLRAIDRLGAVTAEQLLVFMVENELMGYIALQLGLAELCESGLVRKQPHALGTLHAITGKGRDALSMFENRVPHSRLASIDECAAAWRKRFRREKTMPADFEKLENGTYAVRLRLLENDENLLDMTIGVPTHEEAQRFSDAWQEAASSIYAHIMRTLGEGE